MRVWAARGLLYAWHGSAEPAVRCALEDESWRVREAALKVVARRGLTKERALVERMRNDDSARVRASALRTLRSLTN
jgi:HEAT repeat protein